jgi:hypothetical protein
MEQRTRASLFVFINLAAALPFLALPLLTACGTPGPPQPPSLHLPQPPTDLTAARVGNEVHLHWTMPKRSTDRVLLKGDQDAHICRSIAKGPCESAGDAQYAPLAAADFTDHLPAALTSGSPQLITYTVELRNRRGRTAGPSNPAYSASGVALTKPAAFHAEIRADGVVLHWQPAPDGDMLIRIQRTLIPKPGSSAKTASAPKPTSASMRQGAEVSLVQTLEVPYASQHDPARAFDKDAAYNQVYRYTAQRVTTLTLNGRKIEIASDPSDAFTLNTRDIFPPVVPSGLIAVASPDEHVIDLSWSPNAENDLAGYFVYRREAGSSAAPVRISPEPVATAAFRDADARPGTRYAYSVSAVDQDHNESARSQETEEALPQ